MEKISSKEESIYNVVFSETGVIVFSRYNDAHEPIEILVFTDPNRNSERTLRHTCLFRGIQHEKTDENTEVISRIYDVTPIFGVGSRTALTYMISSSSGPIMVTLRAVKEHTEKYNFKRIIRISDKTFYIA